ncbi:hypothetical protein QBC38DRAFT_189316 [Podospora fimiseda]|uniref:Uncharacterized protein n=1 Tax=Podospora fimiseda TaxID=252190 RepID=A0AAN7BQ37_9PEZI|nr:hypothetical protein QBC38DRAFT_189316 [Podospora fimiseda]
MKERKRSKGWVHRVDLVFVFFFPFLSFYWFLFFFLLAWRGDGVFPSLAFSAFIIQFFFRSGLCPVSLLKTYYGNVSLGFLVSCLVEVWISSQFFFLVVQALDVLFNCWGTSHKPSHLLFCVLVSIHLLFFSTRGGIGVEGRGL